jgi:hypothetical protein
MNAIELDALEVSAKRILEILKAAENSDILPEIENHDALFTIMWEMLHYRLNNQQG